MFFQYLMRYLVAIKNHVTYYRISGFSGSLFHVFPIFNEVFSGDQEKESIIHVKMG